MTQAGLTFRLMRYHLACYFVALVAIVARGSAVPVGAAIERMPGRPPGLRPLACRLRRNTGPGPPSIAGGARARRRSLRQRSSGRIVYRVVGQKRPVEVS